MTEIILFNANIDEKSILANLCDANNINLVEISMKDLDQRVGYLANIDGFEREDLVSDYEEKYDFTFMLFKDFSNDEIFDFIKKMKENNLYIPHKAGLTDSNIKWTLRFLLDENDDEHKTMGLINEINRLVKIAHDHKEEHGENPIIKEQVMKINKYFSDPDNFKLDDARKLKDDLEVMINDLI